MHLKSKALFIFYLSIFVSFSAFAGITESFTKWKDDFLTDQANKFDQARDEHEKDQKEAATWIYMSEDNQYYKIGIEIPPKGPIESIKINSMHKALMWLALRTLAPCVNFYAGTLSLAAENKDFFPSSGMSKNILIASALSLLVGLSKFRLKPALVTFLLSSAIGVGFLTEGQIRSFFNALLSTRLMRLPIKDSLFEKNLKAFNEFLGCEISQNSDSDDRSYTVMPSKLLRVLVDNAEAHQKSIFLRLINKINPFTKDVSKEYVELENIFKDTSADTLVKVPKYLLPYLLDHLYRVYEYWHPACGKPPTLIHTMDGLLIRCHRNMPKRTDEVFYHPLELLDILDVIPGNVRFYEFKRDEDGTPRIYEKDDQGNLVQNDRMMKLCGLHGISYSTIKEKQEQQASTVESLKEQREQAAAA